MKLPLIKELVAEGKPVYFSFYRDGELWYKTEILGSGGQEFEFPIPPEDMKGALFKAQDKSIYFMRFMRKYLEFLQENIKKEGV